MFFKVGVPKHLQLYLDDLPLYFKEALTQMFSCEILQIFKNTYFTERFLRWLLLEGHTGKQGPRTLEDSRGPRTLQDLRP